VKAVFVTGTDTGCGKTTASRAIARAAVAAGLRVRVLKPIETGCAEQDGERIPADARALAAAARDPRSDAALCPYRLLLPAAPAVAARAEGVAIQRAVLREAFERTRVGADLVIVEGAGGLLVPIRDDLDMAGLAAELQLPLLVVARSSLGTINHTQLTLQVAAARSLRVACVVLNDATACVSPAERENAAWLRERLDVQVCFELAHVPAADARETSSQHAAHVPVERLLAALG
jgi:dethiobiotin synthetase